MVFLSLRARPKTEDAAMAACRSGLSSWVAAAFSAVALSSVSFWGRAALPMFVMIVGLGTQSSLCFAQSSRWHVWPQYLDGDELDSGKATRICKEADRHSARATSSGTDRRLLDCLGCIISMLSFDCVKRPQKVKVQIRIRRPGRGLLTKAHRQKHERAARQISLCYLCCVCVLAAAARVCLAPRDESVSIYLFCIVVWGAFATNSLARQFREDSERLSFFPGSNVSAASGGVAPCAQV